MGPLYEFDRDEWWDVCRVVRPDLSWEVFEVMWEAFVEWKAKKQLN